MSEGTIPDQSIVRWFFVEKFWLAILIPLQVCKVQRYDTETKHVQLYYAVNVYYLLLRHGDGSSSTHIKVATFIHYFDVVFILYDFDGEWVHITVNMQTAQTDSVAL